MTVFFLDEVDTPSSGLDFKFEQAEPEDIAEFVDSRVSDGDPFRFVPWLADHENISLSEKTVEEICSVFESATSESGDSLKELEEIYWKESIQGTV